MNKRKKEYHNEIYHRGPLLPPPSSKILNFISKPIPPWLLIPSLIAWGTAIGLTLIFIFKFG